MGVPVLKVSDPNPKSGWVVKILKNSTGSFSALTIIICLSNCQGNTGVDKIIKECYYDY